MVKLPQELMDALKEKDTIKVLTTFDENGVPHTVLKDSITALDEKRLAYMELIETSMTQRNMLKNFWRREVKPISIAVINRRMNLYYQIKGMPDRFLYEGPIWEEMLDRVWAEMPDTNPSGVWIIIPQEIIDERYDSRLEAEAKRRPDSQFWLSIHGKRP